MDERIKKLAKVLVHHSCRVQQGEKVYINYTGYETTALARQIIKEACLSLTLLTRRWTEKCCCTAQKNS